MVFSYSEVNYSLPVIRYLNGSRSGSLEQLPLAAVTSEAAIIGTTSVQYGPIVAQDISGLGASFIRPAPSAEALVAFEQPRARLSIAPACQTAQILAPAAPARIVCAQSQETVLADPRLIAAPTAPLSNGTVTTTSNEHVHQTVNLINDGTGLKREVINHITKVNDIHHYRIEHVKGETREFNDFKEKRAVEPAKCARA